MEVIWSSVNGKIIGNNCVSFVVVQGVSFFFFFLETPRSRSTAGDRHSVNGNLFLSLWQMVEEFMHIHAKSAEGCLYEI